MSCRNETSRLIVKRSRVKGERATVPPNEDHKSGLWSSTDIYKGEFFYNQVDGVLQTRDDNGISTIKTDSLAGGVIYKAHLSQNEAEDPTAEVIVNNTHGTVVWTRVEAGVYRGTLVGAFSGSIEVVITQPSQTGFHTAYRPKGVVDYIEVQTPSDGFLDGDGFSYITVIKHQ